MFKKILLITLGFGVLTIKSENKEKIISKAQIPQPLYYEIKKERSDGGITLSEQYDYFVVFYDKNHKRLGTYFLASNVYVDNQGNWRYRHDIKTYIAEKILLLKTDKNFHLDLSIAENRTVL